MWLKILDKQPIFAVFDAVSGQTLGILWLCSILHDFLCPVQSTKSQYRVWKETEVYYGTSKGNKYEIGGKYIFQYFLSQLYNLVILYITTGIREPFLCLALKLLLNTQSLLVSLSRFIIAHTLFILRSVSTYHTFYKIRCLWVVLRICKPFIIVLSNLSLLCSCGN